MEQGAISTLLLSISEASGNPASIHASGRKAKAAVDHAREQVAAAFGIAEPDTILFTSSATEATNTVLQGFFRLQRKEGRKVRFLVSAVEHEATLETARQLALEGAELEILPVDANGALDLQIFETKLLAAPKDVATLVSLMAANNETGVIFPWQKAAKIAKEHGAHFHLDAVQAPGKIPEFTLEGSHVDAASFSAHKMGGMKGVGALYLKQGFKLQSLIHGGAQERKRRAGTVNVPGIAAFGTASVLLASRDLDAITRLRDLLESQVKEKVPGTSINGGASPRIGNTANFLFEGVRGESLLMGLDIEGYCVSSGSACNSGSILPSHVLLAMGHDKLAAQSAVRVSLGPSNSETEILGFVAALEKVVGRIRSKGASALRQTEKRV